jgi:molybdate transport system ATP-binding protein
VVGALEIGTLLDSSPAKISGGEKQRVGLARALMSGPELLLLDEPFSSLDGGLKTRVLPYLSRVRDQFQVPILYVTHDASDILALADEMILLDKGKVVSQGEPERVLGQDAVLARWVPRPIENLLVGKVESHAPEKGLTQVRVGEPLLWAPLLELSIGTQIQLDIPAGDILVALSYPQDVSARNILEGRLESIERSGESVLLKVWAGFPLWVRLTPDAVDHLGLLPGKRVFIVLKSSSIRCL